MLETRRAEGSLERIKAWTGDNYEATTVADAVKLDKFIRECLETADNLERALFSSVTGGESALTGGEEIKEAKNLLGIVQTTADLFKCTFEEAKRMNYADAIVAMSKRHDEIEKEKRDIKKANRKSQGESGQNVRSFSLSKKQRQGIIASTGNKIGKKYQRQGNIG